MTTAAGTQSDLFAWAQDLERENKRIAEIDAQRVGNRGYLVFATDPSKGVDSAEYQQVYATEARTPNQAIAKVRPLAEGPAAGQRSPAAGVPEHGEVPGRAGGGSVGGVGDYRPATPCSPQG